MTTETETYTASTESLPSDTLDLGKILLPFKYVRCCNIGIKRLICSEDNSNLVNVDCFDNDINFIDLEKANITYLTVPNNLLNEKNVIKLPNSIQTLILNGNKFNQIELLAKFNSLKNLDISSNFVKNIDALAKLPNLFKLDASDNEISLITEIPVNLQELYLSKNRISNLLFLTNNLRVLDVSKNKLTHVTIIKEGLQELNVSHCEIHILNIQQDTLIKLIADYNNLVDIKYVPIKLEELSLVGNYFTEIDMTEYINLKSVNLSDNNLEKFPVLNQGIEKVILNQNQIQVAKNIPKSVKYIDLRENPVMKSWIFDSIPTVLINSDDEMVTSTTFIDDDIFEKQGSAQNSDDDVFDKDSSNEELLNFDPESLRLTPETTKSYAEPYENKLKSWRDKFNNSATTQLSRIIEKTDVNHISVTYENNTITV